MEHMKSFHEKDSNQEFIITKVMMNLFEAGILSGVNTTEFSFMASHYFRMNFRTDGGDQSEFLTEMFKRSLCKDQADYDSKAGSIHITLRGGKKKKRKTRRRYKHKSKRVQTKKKNKKNKSRRKRSKKRN